MGARILPVSAGKPSRGRGGRRGPVAAVLVVRGGSWVGRPAATRPRSSRGRPRVVAS